MNRKSGLLTLALAALAAQRHFSQKAGFLVLCALAVLPAFGQTYSVLHNFTGPDGEVPYSSLVMDAGGNLYGTTVSGGVYGYGTVFKLDSSGNENLPPLHSFNPNNFSDGSNPYAGLIMDAAGNLYGTTVAGGSTQNGTVFKVDASGGETLLYSFTNTNGDGRSPYGGLLMDVAGNVYGTTTQGGSSDNGTVFKLDTSGNETVLYRFTNTSGDGASTESKLVMDAAGNLYGTTTQGGTYGYGTVFKLDTSGNETVLHSFNAQGDGAEPIAGLVLDASGNLYGTTYFGGNGFGTVFKLDASGNETVLYSFTSGSDGADPRGGVIMDASGNLYGTTEAGGLYSYGTVWRLDISGNETVLHNFAGPPNDGAGPGASLLLDSAHNLYGTTESGGSAGGGIVFNLAAPNFSISVTPPSETVKAGKTATYTVSITPTGGFTGGVSLSCSDPKAFTCAISPASVTLNGTSASASVRVTTSPGKKGTSKGTYSVTVTGTSGALSHAVSASLTVD